MEVTREEARAIVGGKILNTKFSSSITSDRKRVFSSIGTAGITNRVFETCGKFL